MFNIGTHHTDMYGERRYSCVVYWPIPGRECILDVALSRSEARILGQDTEVRFPLGRNNVTPLHGIHTGWSLLDESSLVTIRRRLGNGNTPLTTTLSSDLLYVSYGSVCHVFLQVSGNVQVMKGCKG
jgi:hypothetical protein